jgi:RimJ/RimL family protein N-acetyltransferase
LRLAASGAYAAYPLACLDASLLPQAEFFEADWRDRSALLMHSRGGLGASSFVLGDASLAGVLLSLHPGPRQTFLTCTQEHVDAILSTHNLWRPQTMLRMQLDGAAFEAPASLRETRRLVAADAPELNALYSIEEDGLRYSGRQVSENVYFGASVRGRLVAAAGTHIYSRSEGVAVIGNVFTHPDYRGRGLGTAVTAAVTAHVLADCRLVVLNVDPANRTARHIYERLGFRDAGRLIEAMATRRVAVSPLALARRVLARWRAEGRGREAVLARR